MKYLLILAGMLLVTPAFAQDHYFTAKHKDRSIALIGQIDGSQLSVAQDIESMSRESSRPIYMLVNSSGGSVTIGLLIVEAIRQAKYRGVKVHCATSVIAASMAFIIMAECSHRYATPYSRLLFHPVSLSQASGRIQEMIIGMDHTIREEREIMTKLQKQLGMSWKGFHRNYFAETFWTARALAKATEHVSFLRLVTRVEGFGDNVFKFQRPKPFRIFGKHQSKNTDAEPHPLTKHER